MTKLTPSQWNSHAQLSPDGGFLQSFAWGEFQAALGNAVFHFIAKTGDWAAQAIKLSAGKFWLLYIPRGPIYIGNGQPDADSLAQFLLELKGFALANNCFLLRFDPPWFSDTPYKLVADTLVERGAIIRTDKHRQPIHTLIVEAPADQNAFFEAMSSKHRYNIRLAEKKGIEIVQSTDPKETDQFFSLLQKTTGRQQFASYKADYFTQLMDSLAPSNQAMYVFARYEGKTIAALLLGLFGKSAVYLHGASDYDYRHLMAPHLLQWQALKIAQSAGLTYDFWGVAADPPANEQEKEWEGITRFKKGFAPQTPIAEFVGTFEAPVKKLAYNLYKLRNRFR